MLITSPVVKAKPADKEAVIEICKEDHAENGWFPLSVPKLEDMVSRILDRGEGVIGLIRKASEIEAILLMQVSQFWYSEGWCLEEVMHFVRPQYRRSTNAKDMIQFAKRCSDELGIPLVMGVTSNERTKQKIELYRRQLADPKGAYFIYNLKPMPSPPLAPQAAIA